MEKFKEIISFMCRTAGCFCMGFGLPELFTQDYKVAAWIYFSTLTLFAIGYFIEKCSK